MKSYTALRSLYGSLTLDTSSTNLTFGSQIMNDDYRHMLALRDWSFLHRLRTATTVASTTFVALPYDVDLVESVFVTVSGTRHTPKPAPSREFWDRLHQSVQTSDTPEYWYVFNGEIGLYPRPATSSNVISINARVRAIDLNTADDTTRTITTLANGSTALTVSAGLTAQMAGFWIRPTFSTTANTGDGQWYEIASVTSGTVGTLVRNYGGVSIAVGTASSTIAQMPLLPEIFHDTPVYGAAAIYWYRAGERAKADAYKKKHDDDMAELLLNWSSPNTNMVLDDGDDFNITNPNLVISL
jgi:hypothetical protein